jgi:hypothetical protein
MLRLYRAISSQLERETAPILACRFPHNINPVLRTPAIFTLILRQFNRYFFDDRQAIFRGVSVRTENLSSPYLGKITF